MSASSAIAFVSGWRGSGPLWGAAALLVLWELAARVFAGAYLLAGPVEIAVYLSLHAGLMLRALRETLGNAALGFVAGNLVAVGLAMLAQLWPRSRPAVSSLALVVFCVPLVASGPILRVLLGPGPGPQIALAALAVYYTTFVPLLVGLKAAPASWFDLVRSYGRGPLTELIRVRARAALPYLFAGLQIAAPAAFLGAMVGEFTGAERGMGVLTIRAMRALDVDATWALATIAALVSILAYSAFGRLTRLVLLEKPPVILAPPQETGAAGGPFRAVGRAALVFGLVLALWWGVLEAANLSPFFAKRPGDIWAAFRAAPDAGDARATLFGALAETAIYVVPGYLAGLAVGAGLAVLILLMPAATSVAMPLAVALRSVPIVTTAPLLVLALGRGAVGTIALVAVMVFFPTFVSCLHGLRQAPGHILDVFDSYGAGRFRRLVHVHVPAMLPAFFAAARMAVPASVLAVTVVEWLATGRGVGSLMALSASLSDYDILWGSVVVVSLLSVLGYATVGMLERRVLAVYAAEQVIR